MRTVKDVMTKSVRTISPDATMEEAARSMKRFRIGSLVVVEGDTPVGIITERDLAYKIVAEGKMNAKVKEVMSRDLKTVDKEKTLIEAVKIMAAHVIRRLPVVDKGKLVGIVTLNDIMKAEKMEEEARAYSFT
jgi:CBS domain-containing protein